ncbi:unnamed protein product [Staurois parvus]|uniref:Uncharacterized protein n=1 Tax=Staurois parvus TaxID=386267 RepID=A0ABN9GGY9_9NEOB|nr:unnamed protein product [Staurois parvus]
MCDKLDRNILCSVFCPSENLENALHAFFMIQTQALINAICSM